MSIYIRLLAFSNHMLVAFGKLFPLLICMGVGCLSGMSGRGYGEQAQLIDGVGDGRMWGSSQQQLNRDLAVTAECDDLLSSLELNFSCRQNRPRRVSRVAPMFRAGKLGAIGPLKSINIYKCPPSNAQWFASIPQTGYFKKWNMYCEENNQKNVECWKIDSNSIANDDKRNDYPPPVKLPTRKADINMNSILTCHAAFVLAI